MREDEKLVTVGEYENTFDAELAKLTLDNAGVESVILGQELVGMLVYGVPSLTIKLQVRQADIEKAKQILAEKEPLTDDGDDDEESGQ